MQIQDYVGELVGESLVEVIQSGRSVWFKFSTSTLVVTPDTDLDPWVLTLPGGFMVGGLQ